MQPRSRQLNRERQAVQPVTDRGDGRDIVWREAECRRHCLGLLDEELKNLLKAKGIDTQGKLSKALMEEFNTVTITPTHVSQWKEKLRGEPVAF